MEFEPAPPAHASGSLPDEVVRLRQALAGRHIVLVGLMGAGKTSVGRRLAQRMGFTFIDSDHAIEEAAHMRIPEIFALRGEAEFRAGERRVIARLLNEPQQVIATGGGAYMDAQTRTRIREKAVSLWLKAELPVLMKRVSRRQDRPLLANADPEGMMRTLIDKRYPIYAEADVTVISQEVPHDQMVQIAIKAMNERFSTPSSAPLPAEDS